jgi:16S rRNA processing protein RimM
MQVVVGRIARAHGIRGDMTVEVRTDDPEGRFAPGSKLATEPPGAGPLTVASVRWHSGRLLVSFEEAPDRTAAEALRGTLLVVDIDDADRPEDPEEYFDHHLVGLAVETVTGEVIGVVDDVLHLPGQDVLAVRRENGREVLVPFVAAIVPVVDLEAGKAVIDPPTGLLDVEGSP